MSGTPVSSSPVIAVTEPVPVANAPVVEVKPDSANDTIATQKAEEKPQTNEVFYMSTQEKGATLMSSMTNMVNSIIGAGVLSIPSTVRKAGIVGSFILLSLSLYLSLEGAHMLSDTSVYTKEDSYGSIGKKVGVAAAGLIGDISMIVFDLGISVAYLLILFQQTIDLLHSWCHIAVETLATWKPLICSLIALFFAFPLLGLPTMDSLRFTSGFAIVCIVMFAVISIIKGVSQLVKGGLEYSMFPNDWSLLPSAVSVFFTSMCCHVNIPKMTAELKMPSTSRFANKTKKMHRVNTLAFLTCGGIYFIVGAFGYLAYGNKIGANLLDNFSQDQAWYLNIVKCAYGIVMLFSYPVLSYAALVTFDKLCFKQPRPAARRYAEAFVWTVISTFIAIVLPDLDTIFGITGSLCGILLNFALPAYYYIAMSKKEKAKEKSSQVPFFTISKGRLNFSWFIFYLGIVADVVFTGLQIKDVIGKLS